ncbi:hypothetical protein JG687_00002213 [Phytophthora cactorum]|uniref:Uncharacterized protein n=1 Tax=Phytophthora cactorum TaxID=29920 RepID=A0A8T1UVM8_9STRA|nr:hypothetical protein JG687_00002213 [Phytophthora cactorum]
MPEYSLQQIFAVTPLGTWRSQWTFFLDVFRLVPEVAISWPDQDTEFADYAAMIDRTASLAVIQVFLFCGWSGGGIREYRELMNFNTQLASVQQAAEWEMRLFQGSFA